MQGLALLGIACLGLLFGVILCLLAFAAFILYRTAADIRDSADLQDTRFVQLLTKNSQQINGLRTEVAAALTKLDAAQLHEASLAIQRSAGRLARSVSMLYKLALSQEGTAAIAAEELAEEEISPYSGRAVTPPDPAAAPMGPQEVLAYQQRLQQKMSEIERMKTVGETSTISTSSSHLPDIQEGWALDDAEFADDGGGIA